MSHQIRIFIDENEAAPTLPCRGCHSPHGIANVVRHKQCALAVDRHANPSAASIPLALNTALEDGRIKEGQLVLMEAMGGGFTWGAVLARW